jgi:hypothetical protein
MSVSDTIKDIAHIASTAGISKDVIDLLEKKAALISEQLATLEQENTALLRENRSLKLENENLKTQLQNVRPKSDELEEGAKQILIALANFDGSITASAVIQQLGLPKPQGQYWFDQLHKGGVLGYGPIGTEDGFPVYVNAAGRDYLAKHGLLGAKPARPLREYPPHNPFGGHSIL